MQPINCENDTLQHMRYQRLQYSKLQNSFHFYGHFPGGSWLAGTRTSPFCDFTGAKDDGGGSDNWS